MKIIDEKNPAKTKQNKQRNKDRKEEGGRCYSERVRAK